MKVVNCFNFPISAYRFTHVLLAAELNWRMHRAQFAALEGYKNSLTTELFTHATPEGSVDLKNIPLFDPLRGIPVQIDDSLPMTVIELRRGEDVLVRMENLAVPAVFANA